MTQVLKDSIGIWVVVGYCWKIVTKLSQKDDTTEQMIRKSHGKQLRQLPSFDFSKAVTRGTRISRELVKYSGSVIPLPTRKAAKSGSILKHCCENLAS